MPRRPPETVRKALEYLELENKEPLTAADVKAKWKSLVGGIHPDAGGSGPLTRDWNGYKDTLIDWIRAGCPDEEESQPRKPGGPHGRSDQDTRGAAGEQSGERQGQQDRSRSAPHETEAAVRYKGGLVDWFRGGGRWVLRLGIFAVVLIVLWKFTSGPAENSVEQAEGSTPGNPTAVYAGFSTDAAAAADYYIDSILKKRAKPGTDQPLFDDATIALIRQEIIKFESLDVPIADIDAAIRARNLSDIKGGHHELEYYGSAFSNFESFMRIDAYKAAYGRTLLDLVSTPELRQIDADYLIYRQYGPIRYILGQFPANPPHGAVGDDPNGAVLCVNVEVEGGRIVAQNRCRFPVRLSYCYAANVAQCEPNRYVLWDREIASGVSQLITYQTNRGNYLSWHACASPYVPHISDVFDCQGV